MNRKSVLQPRTRKLRDNKRQQRDNDNQEDAPHFTRWNNRSPTSIWPSILASDAKNRRTMRTTMSTFKTRQSTAGGVARASIGVRYSMGGKASIGPGSTVKTDKKKLHTNKDPRKLNEKAWVQFRTSTNLLWLIKGSSDPSHFIFEINVGKSRIRHRTTLNLN